MMDARVVFKDGSSKELSFIPKMLGELMWQVEKGVNDSWDLGGHECETKDIQEVLELGECVQCGVTILANEDHCSPECVAAYTAELEAIVEQLEAEWVMENDPELP